MRNALRFPTNLPTYLTARLDATESSWTTRSLVFTIGLPLVSPTRKDRIRMRSQIRRSVRGLYSSHGKRLTLSHAPATAHSAQNRSEEHTSELQSRLHLVCRLLLEKKK